MLVHILGHHGLKTQWTRANTAAGPRKPAPTVKPVIAAWAELQGFNLEPGPIIGSMPEALVSAARQGGSHCVPIMAQRRRHPYGRAGGTTRARRMKSAIPVRGLNGSPQANGRLVTDNNTLNRILTRRSS